MIVLSRIVMPVAGDGGRIAGNAVSHGSVGGTIVPAVLGGVARYPQQPLRA